MWALLHAELSRPGMTPGVENPLRALTQAALRGDVQYGQRVALIATPEEQIGQSRINATDANHPEVKY